jgi:7-cyano-7-deazaguanine synthase
VADNVVLLSGGVDSATLVASLAAQREPTRCLFVEYGQTAARNEYTSADAVATYYGFPLLAIRLDGLRFGEGEIRGRNAFLLHTGLLALPPGPTVLMIGIHGGTPYVDCAQPFLETHQRSFDLHTEGEVQIAAPFIDMNKGAVLRLAQELDVPLQVTYSCERGGTPCGRCLSCLDRAHISALA